MSGPPRPSVPLAQLRSGDDCQALVADAWALMEELYPICRSITGQGVRATLDAVGRRIPLARSEVPSGTQVFDWQVPREWNIRGAWIKDAAGRTVLDFANHNLHVVSYSAPLRAWLTLDELRPHL
ncbi:MAG TPA: DUF4910 domain-containing protein, partial [Steroidobacteraceae bacterium]|nr:DUF4910 domain-containing protein [Steroidobacteraceae bacterium]